MIRIQPPQHAAPHPDTERNVAVVAVKNLYAASTFDAQRQTARTIYLNAPAGNERSAVCQNTFISAIALSWVINQCPP
jgi:hypothetical protein